MLRIGVKNRRTILVAALLLGLVSLYFFEALAYPFRMISSAHSDIILYISKIWALEFSSFTQYHQIPLWNSYSLLGNTLVGNNVSWLFYPFNLLHLVSSSPYVETLNFIAHFFMLGFFTFLYVRKISGSSVAGVFSAIAITFTGRVLLLPYVGHVFFLGFAYFPLFLYLVELIIEKKHFGYAALLGAAIALQLLGTHIQLFFYSLVVLIAYALFRLAVELRKDRDAGRIAILLGSSFVIFFLLAAFQLLPLLETAQITSRDSDYASLYPTYKFSLISLPTIIFPNILGTPLHDTQFGPPNYWDHNAYFGIVALLLAGLALLYRRNQYTIFFAGLLLFSFLFAIDYFNILPKLPGFNLFRIPSRMLFIGAFAVSVLCGYGATVIQKYRLKDVKAVLVLPMLAIVMILGTVAFMAVGHNVTSFLESSINSRLNSQDITKDTADNYLSKLPVIYGDMKQDMIKATFFLVLSSLVIIPALLAKGRSKSLLLGIILALLLLDLWIFGSPFFDAEHPQEIYVEDEFIQTISKDSSVFRVLDFSDNNPIYSSTAARQGINIIASCDSQNLESEFMYLKAAGLIPEKGSCNLDTSFDQSRIHNPSLVNLMNVKYLISESPVMLNTTFISEEGRRKLYRNNDFREKVFMAYDVRAISSQKIVFENLADNFADYSETILLESSVQLPKLETGNSSVKLEQNSPNIIHIGVSTTSSGFLFLSEGYAPGWSASIDGIESKIYRANGAFMGLFIPEGMHSITFSYFPNSFRIGIIVSAVSAAGIIFFFLFQLLRSHVKRNT